jgi:hypothetical protein
MKRVLKGVLGGLLPSSEGVPAKRVLKVDENRELMTRQLQIVSHEKGVEKTEARGGLHTRPKPVSHERVLKVFMLKNF